MSVPSVAVFAIKALFAMPMSRFGTKKWATAF
jgi:hypothetical protein